MNTGSLQPGQVVGLNRGLTRRRKLSQTSLDALVAKLGQDAAWALWAAPWAFARWEGNTAVVASEGEELRVHWHDLRRLDGEGNVPPGRNQASHPISTRCALLQALSAGAGWGGELIERVRARTSGAIELQSGSVYPTLHILVRDGLIVQVRKLPQGRGGRPKVVFDLTQAGWAELRQDRTIITSLAETTAAWGAP